MISLRRISYFLLVLCITAGLSAGLTGCQSDGQTDGVSDEADDIASQLDRARAWVEDKTAMVQDAGEMIDAYERGDMERAGTMLDSLQGSIDWEGMGGPQMRDRILTIGTEVYAALDRPEEAARLIENALPHLEGDLRAQWDDLRTRLEDGSIPTTLDLDPLADSDPAE